MATSTALARGWVDLALLGRKICWHWVIIAVAFLFIGCAQTHVVIYDKSGRVSTSMFIQGDVKNLTVKTKDVHFHVDELNHSVPTAAGGQVVMHTTSYLSGLAAILRLIIPFMP